MGAKYSRPQQIIEDLIDNDGRLIVNMGYDATGHVIVESDNFLRMRLLREFPKNLTSFFFCPEDDKVADMRKLFGINLFDFWAVDNQDATLAAMVANVHPEITVDIGIHSLKMGAPEDAAPWGFKDGCYYYYPGPFGAYRDHLAYLKRRAATKGQFPLAPHVPLSDELETFIGARGGKVAVLHVRTVETSGNAQPADPMQYGDSLAYLKDCGYTIVFAGREPCPDQFQRFGVVDYSGSHLATFENDWKLMKRAHVGIMSASGINLFLDVLGTPYLALNSKLHAIPPFGNAVWLPSIRRERTTGRQLTFLEHVLEYNRNIHAIDPSLTAEHPAAEDILDAVKETVDLAANPEKPMTDLQKKLRGIESDPRLEGAIAGYLQGGGCIHYSQSRLSSGFLERNQHLL